MITLTTRKGLDMIMRNYANTVHELNFLKKRLSLIDEYEKSLKSIKEKICHLISSNQNVIDQMEKDIKKLSGIENKLYYEIVINGTNVTKAVDKVSQDEFIDISTIWKNYYPKVKKEIDALYLLFPNEN